MIKFTLFLVFAGGSLCAQSKFKTHDFSVIQPSLWLISENDNQPTLRIKNRSADCS